MDLEKVRKLDFRSIKITDAGLEEVAKLPKLEEIWLGGRTKLTMAGVAQLQKALPKCRIHGGPKK